jgi:hypothetical protein
MRIVEPERIMPMTVAGTIYWRRCPPGSWRKETRMMDGDQPIQMDPKTTTIVPSQKPGMEIHRMAKLRAM